MVDRTTISEFKNDSLWRRWIEAIENILHETSAWRLKWIVWGILMAVGRKTVSSWIRAAEVQHEFQRYYYMLSTLGRKSEMISKITLSEIIKTVRPIVEQDGFIEIVIDDSPTKRYGPKIEGAGYHHNPTPGKTDAKFCYGHSWVTISLTVRHPKHGTISLPLRGEMYVREKDIPALREQYPSDDWKFRTKLEIGIDLILWAKELLADLDLPIRVIVDGGYAKESFVGPLIQEEGNEIITRLRRDAKLFDVPPEEKPRRGRPRIYGKHRILLKRRASRQQGWREVECTTYGRAKTKRYKTFFATTRLTKGPVRVVLIRESSGEWVPLISTNVDLTAKEIIESYSDRYGIEENYQQLKETWQVESPQVRNVYSNVGVMHLCMWMLSMTAIWSWSRPDEELVDRSRSPWDKASRRPSSRDRVRALRRHLLSKQLNRLQSNSRNQTKIQNLLSWLCELAL